MNTILISILAFIFGLSLLVAFHEYGHFITARFFGVKVIRFSIGFGRPIFKRYSKSGTEYTIGWIPLGGYVKMIDDRDSPPIQKHELTHTFKSKPAWQRILIVLAGPVFNFIFAIFAYWFMFMLGIKGVIPIIGEITPDSVADKAGLIPDTEIVLIQNKPVRSWQDVMTELAAHVGSREAIIISTKDIDQNQYHHSIAPQSLNFSGQIDEILNKIGITPKLPILPPIVGAVIPGEASSEAGIMIGDRILAIDNKEIESWQEFVGIITLSPGKDLSFTILRENELVIAKATPRLHIKDSGESVGFMGIQVQSLDYPEEMLRQIKLSPSNALKQALLKTKYYSELTLKMLGKMILGDVSMSNLSGPVTIAHGAGQTVMIGVAYYLGFLAIISISLGVINLLPIPVLDGGHLLFYITEMIIRRPVPQRIQYMGYQLGFILIICLMAIAFYNDFVRFS